MSWLGLLIAVAVVVAIIAVMGTTPRGARPVARSGLMAAARIVLVVIVAVLVYAFWRR